MMQIISNCAFMFVLKEWLSLQEVCKLDSAFCNYRSRNEFLHSVSMCQFSHETFSKKIVFSEVLFPWMMIRYGVKVSCLQVNEEIFTSQNLAQFLLLLVQNKSLFSSLEFHSKTLVGIGSLDLICTSSELRTIVLLNSLEIDSVSEVVSSLTKQTQLSFNSMIVKGYVRVSCLGFKARPYF